MNDCFLIVGLGNPGRKYARTRHNIGFVVLDRLSERYGLDFGPVDDGCSAASGRIAGVPVVLVKPLLYMNRSGEALRVWLDRRRPCGEEAPRPAPLVVCDDIVLPLGTLRLRMRGGAGGHRGLESLAAAGWGEEYPRCRLGVADPEGMPDPSGWADFVLADFDDRQWETVDRLADRACEALATCLEQGPEIAASRFNGPLPSPGE